MVIDFHTHIFPDRIAEKTVQYLAGKIGFPPFYGGDKKGLLDMQARAGVELAIALPVVTSPKQFDSVNEFALNINREMQDETPRILSFAGIHPGNENIAEKMDFIRRSGFLGVKIHPDYQDAYIDDERYAEIVRRANENDLIVVTHSGVDGGFLDRPVKCTPDGLLRLFDKVEPKKLVLAHFGACMMWPEVYDKLCGLNVYFDTAFTLDHIDEDLFKRIVHKHGEDKILFATDAPWRDMQPFLNKLRAMDLSDEVKEKILHGNAEKLLKLNE